MPEVETILPPATEVDKTKPYTDEQYKLIAKLPDNIKRDYMHGFNPSGWSQKDIERHYQSQYYPKVTYHSANGGGAGTISPPRSK